MIVLIEKQEPFKGPKQYKMLYPAIYWLSVGGRLCFRTFENLASNT